MYQDICCPDGYTFDGKQCASNVAPTTFAEPVPCPCCPVGPANQKLTYITPNGWFYNTYTNSVMQVLSWTGTTLSDVYNKCAITQVAPAAYGVGGPDTTYDPIDCPCCPRGFTWIDFAKICVNNSYLSSLPAVANTGVTDPIPCVVCVCTPPPPFECPTCGTSGERIVFNFSFNTRNCTACVPDPFDPPKGKINCFIPNTLIDPDTAGFKLKQ